jgi:hypothetical protein
MFKTVQHAAEGFSFTSPSLPVHFRKELSVQRAKIKCAEIGDENSPFNGVGVERLRISFFIPALETVLRLVLEDVL